jgi:hypothetical protein
LAIILDMADAAKTRSLLDSDDMKATMQTGGVIGSSTIRFAHSLAGKPNREALRAA